MSQINLNEIYEEAKKYWLDKKVEIIKDLHDIILEDVKSKMCSKGAMSTEVHILYVYPPNNFRTPHKCAQILFNLKTAWPELHTEIISELLLDGIELTYKKVEEDIGVYHSGVKEENKQKFTNHFYNIRTIWTAK